MNRNTWSVARFRFGATFARRRAGYLVLTVLIALLGGLAMGSVAAARRTQSSFPQYLASTNPSQLTGASAEIIPGVFNRGYNPGTIAKIAKLPHVRHVASLVGLNAFPITPSGTIKHLVTDFGMTFVGAMKGSLNQDRITIVAGRAPRFNDGHEFLADEVAVQKLHLHLGQTVTFGIFSNAEEQSQDFGSPKIRPFGRVTAKLVAIITSPQNIVEDDVDASNGNIAFTPPVTRRFLNCCVDFTLTSVQVAGGSAAITTVQHEIEPLTPKGGGPFSLISTTIDKAERAIRPESIAIGAFGAIVALATLVIAGQIIGRQLRAGAGDASTMRALGADPAMTAADGLGTLGAVALGAVLAALVAVGLSPLAPLGPVAPYYPTPGVSFDWTVLGVGVLVLLLALGGLAVVLTYRIAPGRAQGRAERSIGGGSRLVSALSTRLPAPAVVGVRFAVEPGGGVDPVPVRSVILASVLALIIVMSTVIFGASLNSLVSHPSLYGWNWDYELASEFGSGNISEAQAMHLLSRDPDVAAWSGAYFFTLTIHGQVVPIIAERPGAVVAPPVLTGHGLDGSGQIVLGAITLADLHKRIGQQVSVTLSVPASLGGTRTTSLRIVGTSTMPTIGQGTGLHLEMGTGALIPSRVIPAGVRGFGGDNGPDVIFVRLKAGVTPASALPQLKRAAVALGNQNNDGVVVNTVERPAEIVNYRTLGATPTVLGAALAVGAVAGLGLTLLASVRRRRRDLALLKTLGFTKRQLTAVVASQATVAVGLGALIGVPLGIVAGRYLWDLFANEIHAVPAPAVSALTVALIALGALVLGNLVALVPGRLAARIPAAAVLSAD